MTFQVTPPKPIEVQPEIPTRSGLGGMVEGTLVRFLQRVINSSTETLADVLRFGLQIFLEAAERALIELNRGMVGEVLERLPPGSPVTPYLQDMLAGTSQAGFFSLAGFASTMGSSAAGNALGILLRPLGYELDSMMHTARLDPSAAILAYWRREISPGELTDLLGDLGWSEGMVGIWESILRPILDERDTVALYIRDQISEGEMRSRLHQRGYEDPTIDHMLMAVRPLVGPGDLQSLYLRGVLGPAEFERRLAQHGYTDSQVRELAQLAWRLASPGDIVELWRRGQIGDGEAAARMQEHGYTPERIAELLTVARPLTGLGDLTDLYHRQVLSPDEFRRRIGQHGYTEAQIAEIEALIQRIPGPADLVSMAVREAFRPDLIEEYQYLSEYPAEFGEWMTKQGYSEEWAQRYWVAHWALPSLTMAYEMFHRRIISEEQLDRLFAISDIAPFWRPRLLDAAYQPLTRVDVRRMFALGVLTRDDVVNSYLDLGYSPENAELMTQFTERYEAGGEKEASRTDILKAYSIGIISREEARRQIMLLGYIEEWADYYLLMEDYKRAEDLLKMETDILEDQYVDGVIDRSTVFAVLGEWDVPSRQIETYLEQWDIAKRRKVSLPTTAQLEAWLKEGLLSEGEYQNSMRARHYEDTSIIRFLQQIRMEIAADALAEEERARKEQDRVVRAEVKTTYDTQRATYDLQIAELRTALAQNKVLLGTLVDPELVQQLLEQNDQLLLAIQRLEEEKARSKLAYTRELGGMVS